MENLYTRHAHFAIPLCAGRFCKRQDNRRLPSRRKPMIDLSTRTLVSFSVPSTMALNISNKSEFSRTRIACVSGSPNRTLYSSTFGPPAVSINPTKRIPRKGKPSARSAFESGLDYLFYDLI